MAGACVCAKLLGTLFPLHYPCLEQVDLTNLVLWYTNDKQTLFVCVGARVFLPFENLTLPNFTMIHAGQFDDSDRNSDNIIDALWCQSDDGSANPIGEWYRPPDSSNPVPNMGAPLYVSHFPGQVGLYRSLGIGGYEGVYRCSIPDANGTHYNIFLGVYKKPTYLNYSEDSNCTQKEK